MGQQCSDVEESDGCGEETTRGAGRLSDRGETHEWEGGQGKALGGDSEEQVIGDVQDALREGWAIGVCGWQSRREHGISDGAGGLQAGSAPCDFITEFKAPGCGHGRKGAGTRLLAAIKELCVKEGEWKYMGTFGSIM